MPSLLFSITNSLILPGSMQFHSSRITLSDCDAVKEVIPLVTLLIEFTSAVTVLTVKLKSKRIIMADNLMGFVFLMAQNYRLNHPFFIHFLEISYICRGGVMI